jgi:hypothetical protein
MHAWPNVQYRSPCGFSPRGLKGQQEKIVQGAVYYLHSQQRTDCAIAISPTSCARGLMKVAILTKVRSGFSIAIFLILVIGEMVAATGIDIRQRQGAIICIALGLAGLLIWATSGFGKAKPAEPATDQEAPVGQPAQEHPLAPFMSRRYWGTMLMLAAVALAAVSAYRYAEPKPIAPKPKPAVAVPPPEPAVTFPPLKLDGLIVHGTQSSALINGQVLLLGEYIGNVRLVAVDA